MANRRVKLVRPGDEQTTWRGAGDEYRVLATGEDTAGDYFIMEAIVPPAVGRRHISKRAKKKRFTCSKGRSSSELTESESLLGRAPT